MWNNLRVGLLMALALGLSLSSTVSSTRMCIVTFDTCCEADAHSCETEFDCGGEADHDCCLAILSDETFATLPEVLAGLDLSVVPFEYHVGSLSTFDQRASVRLLIPDPPPLSMSDRLAHLELRLI